MSIKANVGLSVPLALCKELPPSSVAWFTWERCREEGGWGEDSG